MMNDLSAPAHTAPIDLDATDQSIINLLRKDGRMPYRAIARELDIAENTVRARVRRMEETGTMRVVAVTDIEAAGYGMLLAIGVQVEGRSPELVAQDMAAIAEVFSVNVVVGAQDIEILVVAQDQMALNDLISDKLGAIPGVRRLTPALALEVLKNQPDWVPFHAT
jgi:DNA-binding Lrp family transcriptional regulator